MGFTASSVVKNLFANTRNTDLISGWKDPLKKEMVIHSSILA